MVFGAWIGGVLFCLLSLALGQDSMEYDAKNHFIWPPSEGANWANDANALADNVAIT
ncbi:hypothetical protein MN608_10124 [Microdochium nivale]|nr:hypothetical protein MN608_10124 [Microdochium nivale]